MSLAGGGGGAGVEQHGQQRYKGSVVDSLFYFVFPFIINRIFSIVDNGSYLLYAMSL